ncbi:MAG: MarR family transcriptional regulator, organic hydroperoxide resistance regulator [Pseudonocardiales bacterium]|jgi:DNA-binding MarR family transcriptional regulator|nr:MarR family transcriptional regulator, organic hydroperoxide resistance regulator [Pseudonocardiales bacterium]
MARRNTTPQFGMELDAQLCFDLYAASRAVTNAYRPMLLDLGLTYPQYLVMLVLWERQSCTVRELGDVLQLDSGTLSPLLKRLTAAGLVRRERRTDDERSVEAVLTDEGRALQVKAQSIPSAIGAAMGLTPAEFDVLKQTLRRLVTNVSNSNAAS